MLLLTQGIHPVHELKVGAQAGELQEKHEKGDTPMLVTCAFILC